MLVDLEKAFDRVSREVIRWALKKSGEEREIKSRKRIKILRHP